MVDDVLVVGAGPAPACHLVRPDGYVGWRGRSWREPGLDAHLDRLFGPA